MRSPRRRRNWGWASRARSYTVILDAWVLYPAPLRDFLLERSASNLFRAKWTDAIHDEWIRNLLKNRPDLTAERLSRTRELMNRAVPDCLVEGYEELIPASTSPIRTTGTSWRRRSNAAPTRSSASTSAISCRPSPKYELEVQHPDEFIHHQVGLDLAAIIVCARRCRMRLRNRGRSVDDFLATLRRQKLPRTPAALRPFGFASDPPTPQQEELVSEGGRRRPAPGVG